jgi:hypothetical protein
MILWRFASSTSSWFIPFFFWSFALGQGIDFRTKKKGLVILLQILVFMLLILGNAYQGVITSFMIEPDHTDLLKSFDELLQSKHTIFVGPQRDKILQDYPAYRVASAKGKIFVPGENFQKVNLTEMFENNTAQLVNCELAYHSIENGFDSMFYVINEELFPSYVYFPVVALNIYLKRWQLIMDWCFEAGLHEAWKKFEKNETSLMEVKENLSQVLKFGDIFVIFYALLLGLALGFVSLLCEIIVNF